MKSGRLVVYVLRVIFRLPPRNTAAYYRRAQLSGRTVADGYKIIADLRNMCNEIKILNCKIKSYLYNVDLVTLRI